MDNEVLGVTTCSHCNKRFRVLRKYLHLVGKEIQCPRCHRPFVVSIQVPSPFEQAAIQQESEKQESAKQETEKHESEQGTDNKPVRRRRTKSEIRGEYYDRIRQSMPALMKRLKAISEQDVSSEEQVRVWCIDVLKVALGYNDEDVDTELNALNQRIDIGIKHDDKVLMVIECKNTRSRLPTNVRDQAAMYAANKSADWAVVTNGQVWKLYRICPVKGRDPRIVEVFDIALLDEDGLSDYDVQCLYLLTKRALTGSDSEREFHIQQSLDSTRVVAAIRDLQTVKVIRKILQEKYKADAGTTTTLDDETVQDRLTELFVPKDL